MRFIFLFLSLALLLPACATVKQKSWLSDHQIMLNKAVANKENPEQQLDELSNSLVLLLGESLDFADPRKGVKFINRYKETNQSTIDEIIKNVQVWTKGMEPMEKVSLGLNIATKPQTKELIALLPKFQKKYKQISFISKILDKLPGSLFNLG